MESPESLALTDVMRHTPGCRAYLDTPVADAELYRVLDNARFAPSGGNRQGWRVIVIRDSATKLALRDLYREPWREYVSAHYGDRESMPEERRTQVLAADRMADTLHEVPVHLAVWIDLSAIAVTDAAANRPSVVAGGSIFPFIQNIQLAARAEGLGTRITTLLSGREEEVRSLLGAPAGFALAALILLGWPQKLPRRLRRKPVEAFASLEHFGGSPLRDPSAQEGGEA